MKIEITRQNEGGTEGQRWEFRVGSTFATRGIQLILELWEPAARPSRRHKWRKAGEGYHRRLHDGHHHFGYRKPAAEVPMPADVVDEAMRRFFEAIEVVGPQDPPERRSRF